MRTYLGHPNEPEDPGEDRRREVGGRGALRSSASIRLTQNAREEDRKGSGASLVNHEARQGLDCGRASANCVNHCGDILRFSARSE